MPLFKKREQERGRTTALQCEICGKTWGVDYRPHVGMWLCPDCNRAARVGHQAGIEYEYKRKRW